MSVRRKRVRDVNTGKFTTVLQIDMQSSTFGEDLAYVFNRNVMKARRENKWVLGLKDIEP